MLCGRPLLEFTAEAALASGRLSRVVLSTDDEAIADIGRGCGLEVPFLRPAELAEDHTPMLPVVQHALLSLEREGARFDAVCLLQPTNPLRTPQLIDACVDLFDSCRADAVITVLPVPPEYNPHWVYFRTNESLLELSTGEASPIGRRQDLPAAFHREGSVYVTRRDVVVEENSLYGRRVAGYVMDAARTVNIDDMEDWQRAERLLCVASSQRHADGEGARAVDR
jgi:CMP-N-acetylneuraminic acid synthetase